MTRRRFVAALAAAAAILAIGHGVYWNAVAGAIRGGIEEFAAARRAEGFVVAYEELAIGGYPEGFVATMTAPSIARPGWRWSAGRLVAEATLFAPGRITVILPGAQRLDYDGGVMEMTLEYGVVRVMAPESLVIEAGGIALVTPRGLFSLGGFEGLVRRGPESRFEIEVDGRGLTLASGATAILGREISALGVTASHGGALPEALSGPALAAWSEAGGTLEIERLEVAWGVLEISASGTATLDKELRPEAAFSAEIAGYGALLDLLASSGGMKSRDASFAKTFLNLMATQKSGRRVIRVAVTAQGGKLFVGPIPLLRLAPVTELF